jgi:hypothetical protein
MGGYDKNIGIQFMSRYVIQIIWHKSNIEKNHDEIVQCFYMLSLSSNQA